MPTHSALQFALQHHHYNAADHFLRGGANQNAGYIRVPTLWLAICCAPDSLVYELACRGASAARDVAEVSSSRCGASLSSVALPLAVGFPEEITSHVYSEITSSSEAAGELERLKVHYAVEFAAAAALPADTVRMGLPTRVEPLQALGQRAIPPTRRPLRRRIQRPSSRSQRGRCLTRNVADRALQNAGSGAGAGTRARTRAGRAWAHPGET
jgi:hypothetical protein